MAKLKKTWILVKGCEYQPGRSISLGQLLLKPYEPSIPLLPGGPLHIPETAIERTYQLSTDLKCSTSIEWSFQTWAKLTFFPIEGEVGPNRSKSQLISWHFEKLETEIMVPRLADIQKAISTEEVVGQINRMKFSFRKRLYMVTGVRIARGATLNQVEHAAVGGDIRAGIDITAFTAAPLTVGAGSGFTSIKSSASSFAKSSDFVYAYRVCEVHYGKDVYVKPHNHGDTFQNFQGRTQDDEDDKDDDDDEGDGKLQHIVVDKIESSDYSVGGIAVGSTPWIEDEGEEEYILPS